jgi:hypothetical protein
MRSRTLINGRVSGGGEQFSADYSDGSEVPGTSSFTISGCVTPVKWRTSEKCVSRHQGALPTDKEALAEVAEEQVGLVVRGAEVAAQVGGMLGKIATRPRAIGSGGLVRLLMPSPPGRRVPRPTIPSRSSPILNAASPQVSEKPRSWLLPRQTQFARAVAA